MQIIEFFLSIVFVGFLVVAYVIDVFFYFMIQLITQHQELIIPVIVLICGIGFLWVIAKRLIRKKQKLNRRNNGTGKKYF